MRRHAPATARNREPIAAVLTEELAETGQMLEIAAGSGEHAVYFASLFPQWRWLPTDPDPEALASIEAWRVDAELPNVLPALKLDASTSCWSVERADAMLCVNMAHISPPEASEGLMAGAGRILPEGSPLILYGPYIEPNVETAPSNLHFDADLRARDPNWGLRNTAWMDDLARRYGLQRTRRVAMPANNLTLVYRKL